MKNLLIIFAAFILFNSCSKETLELDKVNEMELTSGVVFQEVGDPDDIQNKRLNPDTNPNAPGCIEGDGVCREVIIVGSSFVDALSNAIKNKTLNIFLEDEDNFYALSRNVPILIDQLNNVKKDVNEFVEIQSSSQKFVFLTGKKGATTLDYHEAAFVFNIQ